MNVVEDWGSEIPKMIREAKEYGLHELELLDMDNDFRVNLYRKAAVLDQNGAVNPQKDDTNNTLLNLIRENSAVTRKELKEALNVSFVTVKRLMLRLQ